MHIFTRKTKQNFLTQISKCSTPTELDHPDLHLAQFVSLESLKYFLELKMEKIPPD